MEGLPGAAGDGGTQGAAIFASSRRRPSPAGSEPSRELWLPASQSDVNCEFKCALDMILVATDVPSNLGRGRNSAATGVATGSPSVRGAYACERGAFSGRASLVTASAHSDAVWNRR